MLGGCVVSGKLSHERYKDKDYIYYIYIVSSIVSLEREGVCVQVIQLIQCFLMHASTWWIFHDTAGNFHFHSVLTVTTV